MTRKVKVIKGPLFDKVLGDAFVYANKMIQRKLDEGGIEKIRQQEKDEVVNR
jgi:hypothetical protein